MAKQHLARLTVPNTWPIKRRGTVFITKQDPGPHSFGLSIPLGVLLKEVLGFAKNTKEAKKILSSNEVRIDCRQRKNFRFPVGIFDTIEFPHLSECFRVALDKKGKIALVKIKKEEASIKPAKIIGKSIVKGMVQLNLYDGKNITVNDGSYKVGDTLVVSLPDQKITSHLKLGKKYTIFLTGGKHIGETGIVEDIDKNKIVYKDSQGNLVETLKKYAFVIGDSKPSITIG